MNSFLYDIRNLKQRYEKGRLCLDIQELRIKRGITGLIGPNGSGKSTLLKTLALLLPFDGEMLFEGVTVRGNEEKVRREATYLLQAPYLLNRTVYENIAYGLKLRREKCDIGGRVRESLEQVGLAPDDFAPRRWYMLSGGEAQRVALAARLALRPKVLLLDEPTASVDEASAQLVMEASVKAVKESGASVIIATHDINWLYEMSGELISLYGGRIVGRGAENLLQGRWHLDGGFMVRAFEDGQALFAYAAKGAPQTGMLNSSDITLSKDRPAGAEYMNILSGRAVQMTFERSTDSVLVSAEVGENIIKIRTSAAELEKLAVVPSSELWLTFPYAALRFL